MNIDDLLDKSYELFYVDYKDDIDMITVQDILSRNDYSAFFDNYGEYIWDTQMESIKYVIKNDVKKRLIDLEMSEEEADDYIEYHYDELKEEIEKRDVSNTVNEVLHNTIDPACFIALDSSELSPDGDVDYNLPIIKKTLGIEDNKYDHKLSLMIMQAYSHELVVYFQFDLGDTADLFKAESITFHDPIVALIDNWKGAGDHTQLNGFDLTIPYKPGIIHVDKLIKYSYTFDVLGVGHGYWDTNYELHEGDTDD